MSAINDYNILFFNIPLSLWLRQHSKNTVLKNGIFGLDKDKPLLRINGNLGKLFVIGVLMLVEGPHQRLLSLTTSELRKKQMSLLRSVTHFELRSLNKWIHFLRKKVGIIPDSSTGKKIIKKWGEN